MKLELINKSKATDVLTHILENRGILNPKEYFSFTKENISSPTLLGEKVLEDGLKMLIKVIQADSPALVVVDCDCDGYTSAALLINYLYKLFPSWVENKLDWSLHEGKTHGLSDQKPIIDNRDYKLIICPDSSSNDYEIHKSLHNHDINILVLDHHHAEYISPDAVIINNQLSTYPNKDFSGVGIVWQFCRYIDNKLGFNYADDFLDLVALGNCGDMMSLQSKETSYLIKKGFQKQNIKNPFIEYIIDKNNFSLNKSDYKSNFKESACTHMGAAFFIVPFINATTRTGTIEEKNYVFESMLNHKAFQKVPQIKYHKETGQMEYLVEKVMRMITNIKKRQTDDEVAGMNFLEKKIQEEHLLDNKILLIETDQIRPEIKGLVANKLQAKYQRPCIIVTYNSGEKMYTGSMRGYTKTGLDSFMDLLLQCDGIIFVEGHDNAAGVGIEEGKIQNVIDDANRLMKDISTEPVNRIDYFFETYDLDTFNTILDIASFNDLWGTDIDRAYVGVQFKVNESNFNIMKNNTLKIQLPGNISIIKFGGTEEDIENFTTKGWKEILAYCKCGVNEWNGNKTAQLYIEDYEIIDSCKYYF